ncbi:hypothetical protein MA16_Dca002175 [Dendrobium catenatum]|uniref:DUF4283 domain-containing protein n=1 Tax=Dendrobium catenatum TaxID=906689 RepID=A0A2I0XEL9_9ASPA|nr:hypothetical protein MA16_Dca002175 [Dendrobium catenatum]
MIGGDSQPRVGRKPFHAVSLNHVSAAPWPLDLRGFDPTARIKSRRPISNENEWAARMSSDEKTDNKPDIRGFPLMKDKCPKLLGDREKGWKRPSNHWLVLLRLGGGGDHYHLRQNQGLSLEMTRRNTYRRAKKVVSRGGSSRGYETPTPIHPDSTCDQSKEENECSGTQQSRRHSTYEQIQTPNDGILLIGVITRDPVLAPLSFPDLRNKGLEPFKKKMLAEVESKFAFPGHICHWILQSLRVKWRNLKTNLKVEHWDNRPIEEIMESIPAGVDATQWCHLVTQWSQPKDKERAAINSANAKKQTCPHTMGRVSSVRRQQEMAIKDRLLLWRVNRLRKDGTWPSEDANQRWIQACELLAKDGLTPEDGNVEANERVFGMVMEPEHPGRVRTQGFGVTPTRYFPHSTNNGTSSCGSNFSQIVNLKEEVNSLRTEMRQFIQEIRMQHPPQGSSQMPLVVGFLEIWEEILERFGKEKECPAMATGGRRSSLTSSKSSNLWHLRAAVGHQEEIDHRQRARGELVISKRIVTQQDKISLVEGKGKKVDSPADCKIDGLSVFQNFSPDLGASSSEMKIFVNHFGNSSAIFVPNSDCQANPVFSVRVEVNHTGFKSALVDKEVSFTDKVIGILSKKMSHELKVNNGNTKPYIKLDFKEEDVVMSDDGKAVKLCEESKNLNANRLVKSLVFKVFDKEMPSHLVVWEVRRQWNKFGKFVVVGCLRTQADPDGLLANLGIPYSIFDSLQIVNGDVVGKDILGVKAIWEEEGAEEGEIVVKELSSNDHLDLPDREEPVINQELKKSNEERENKGERERVSCEGEFIRGFTKEEAKGVGFSSYFRRKQKELGSTYVGRKLKELGSLPHRDWWKGVYVQASLPCYESKRRDIKFNTIFGGYLQGVDTIANISGYYIKVKSFGSKDHSGNGYYQERSKENEARIVDIDFTGNPFTLNRGNIWHPMGEFFYSPSNPIVSPEDRLNAGQLRRHSPILMEADPSSTLSDAWGAPPSALIAPLKDSKAGGDDIETDPLDISIRRKDLVDKTNIDSEHNMNSDKDEEHIIMDGIVDGNDNKVGYKSEDGLHIDVLVVNQGMENNIGPVLQVFGDSISFCVGPNSGWKAVLIEARLFLFFFVHRMLLGYLCISSFVATLSYLLVDSVVYIQRISYNNPHELEFVVVILHLLTGNTLDV